ncbi:DUF3024 domain-containing protein [Paenibacillus sp. GCM10023252]|uniref:DUF3024 domain-containing protein n=1 Tax=Paenibacillus sp. GCM10023252 TaxID=3252649 RepID=UPI00361AF643
MLDAFTKKRIEKIMTEYIDKKIPKHLRDQIKLNYKFRGKNVTLVEQRPAFKGEGWVELDIAQFRLDQNKWKVYWRDSKDKWHYVEEITPEEDIEKQLKIVDTDNRGLFWG